MSRSPRMRRAQRVPLRAAVSFRREGGRVAYGWSGNISLAGVYVRTDERVPIGTLCRLRLTLRRPEGSVRLEVDAQAARHDPDGIAFQFGNLSEAARALLEDIVEALRRAEATAGADPVPAAGARP